MNSTMEEILSNLEPNKIIRRTGKFATDKIKSVKLPKLEVSQSTETTSKPASFFRRSTRQLTTTVNHVSKSQLNTKVKLISEEEIIPDVNSLVKQYKLSTKMPTINNEILRKYNITSSDHHEQRKSDENKYDKSICISSVTNQFDDQAESLRVITVNRKICATVKDMLISKQSNEYISRVKSHSERNFIHDKMKGVAIKVTESLKNKYKVDKQVTPEKEKNRRVTRDGYLSKCQEVQATFKKTNNSLFTSRTYCASTMHEDKMYVFGGESAKKKNDLFVHHGSKYLKSNKYLGANHAAWRIHSASLRPLASLLQRKFGTLRRME